jgi:hypothetical protein
MKYDYFLTQCKIVLQNIKNQLLFDWTIIKLCYNRKSKKRLISKKKRKKKKKKQIFFQMLWLIKKSSIKNFKNLSKLTNHINRNFKEKLLKNQKAYSPKEISARFSSYSEKE